MRKFIRAASHSIALLGNVTRANVGAATQCGLVAHRAGVRGPHDVLCRVVIASGVGRCRELGEGTQACTVLLAPRVCFRPGSVAQAATHSRARGTAHHADAYVPTEARACFCRAGPWKQRASRRRRRAAASRTTAATRRRRGAAGRRRRAPPRRRWWRTRRASPTTAAAARPSARRRAARRRRARPRAPRRCRRRRRTSRPRRRPRRRRRRTSSRPSASSTRGR